MDKEFFYKTGVSQLTAYLAYRKLREARNAQIQTGGKVITRAEEQKLKLNAPQSITTQNNSIYDDPVPGTSTGDVTGPPLPKGYKKTAKKNIVSNFVIMFTLFKVLHL